MEKARMKLEYIIIGVLIVAILVVIMVKLIRTPVPSKYSIEDLNYALYKYIAWSIYPKGAVIITTDLTHGTPNIYCEYLDGTTWELVTGNYMLGYVDTSSTSSSDDDDTSDTSDTSKYPPYYGNTTEASTTKGFALKTKHLPEHTHVFRYLSGTEGGNSQTHTHVINTGWYISTDNKAEYGGSYKTSIDLFNCGDDYYTGTVTSDTCNHSHTGSETGLINGGTESSGEANPHSHEINVIPFVTVYMYIRTDDNTFSLPSDLIVNNNMINQFIGKMYPEGSTLICTNELAILNSEWQCLNDNTTNFMITSAASSVVTDDGDAYLIDPSLEYALSGFSTSLTYTTPTKLKTLQIPGHTHKNNESTESKWEHTHNTTHDIYKTTYAIAEYDHEGSHDKGYVIKEDSSKTLAPKEANSNEHTHNGKTDSVGEGAAHRHGLNIPILSVYVYYHKYAESADVISELDDPESLDTTPADGNTYDTTVNIAYKWRIYYEKDDPPTTNLQTTLSTLAIKIDDSTTSYWSAMAYDGSQYVYALHTSGALVRSTTYNLQTWSVVLGYKNMMTLGGNWLNMLYDNTNTRNRLIICNDYGYFGFYNGSWAFNDVDWMGVDLDYTYNAFVYDAANDMFLLFATNTTDARVNTQTCLSIPASELSDTTKRGAWSVQTLSYTKAEALSKGIGCAFYSPSDESVYLITNGGVMLVGTYTGSSSDASDTSNSSDASDSGNYTFVEMDMQQENNWYCAVYDEKNKRPFMLGSSPQNDQYPLMAYMKNGTWTIETSDTLYDSRSPWHGMTYISGEDYLVAVSGNGCIATSGRPINTSKSSDNDDEGTSDQ